MSKSTYIEGLISCIIPVYNRPELIAECVSSVLTQTYNNYEIIIVDDGSTDQTKQIIAGLAKEHPEKILVLTQANQGPGAARQLGLNHTRGKYIQFLDSDDLLLSKKFELFIQAFESKVNPDIVYAVTHYYKKKTPKKYTVWKEKELANKSILPNFFVSRTWSTSTPIYKKHLLTNTGPILPLSCEEDLEYDCRIGLQNPKIEFINQHLTDFRDHSGQRFSVDNPNRAKQLSHQIQARQHIYQTMLEFGLHHSSKEMILFSRTMFLLARQAGELGLKQDSEIAFDLARQAGLKLPGKDKLAMQIYKITHSITGTKTGSKLFSGVYNRLHKIKN